MSTPVIQEGRARSLRLIPLIVTGKPAKRPIVVVPAFERSQADTERLMGRWADDDGSNRAFLRSHRFIDGQWVPR